MKVMLILWVDFEVGAGGLEMLINMYFTTFDEMKSTTFGEMKSGLKTLIKRCKNDVFR